MARKIKVIKNVVQTTNLTVINVNTVNMLQPSNGFWTGIFHQCIPKQPVVKNFVQSVNQMMFLKIRIDIRHLTDVKNMQYTTLHVRGSTMIISADEFEVVSDYLKLHIAR